MRVGWRLASLSNRCTAARTGAPSPAAIRLPVIPSLMHVNAVAMRSIALPVTRKSSARSDASTTAAIDNLTARQRRIARSSRNSIGSGACSSLSLSHKRTLTTNTSSNDNIARSSSDSTKMKEQAMSSATESPVGAATSPPRAPRQLSPYANWMALTKLRLSFTSAASGLVTYATTDVASLAGCGVLFSGMMLHAMAANIINEIMERDFDKLMARTRNRPLVTGAIGLPAAKAAAGALLVGGTAVLYAGGGWLPAVLSLATVGLYTNVYTPLKRKTVWNTEIGAIVGAGPPLIGWAFSGASFLLPEPWLMATFLLAWQMPHFMLIATRFKEEYAAGGYQMRSLDDVSGRKCYNYGVFWFFILWVTLWWTYACDVTSIMAPIAGSAPFIWTMIRSAEFRHAPGLLVAKANYLRVFFPMLACLTWPLLMCWLFHQHPNQEFVQKLRETGDSLCVWHGPGRVMETVFDRATKSVTTTITSLGDKLTDPTKR